MRIEALDVDDDAALTSWIGLFGAHARFDAPERPAPADEALRAYMRTPRDGRDCESWVVRIDDGRLAAYAELQLPTLEDRHTADLTGYVHPELRRRGIGTALYRHCARRVRTLGRTNLSSHATGPAPGGTSLPGGPGVAFLERMGMSRALEEIDGRLDVTAVDDDAHDALLAEAWRHAADYELRAWTGRADDDLVAGLATLAARISTDVPTGDLDREAAVYDVRRWRDVEEMTERRRRTMYTAAVRHVPSGTVAGLTELLFIESPRTHASQQITIVDPAHRGHRLGLILKIANLRRARAAEPDLRYVTTSNAVTNTHMLAINERLGFIPHTLGIDFQIDLDPEESP